MNNEDVVAEIALKAAEKEMRLRRIVNQSAAEYYIQIRVVLVMVVQFCVMIGALSLDRGPAWSPIVFALLLPAVNEINRQGRRFDALVELMEWEKNKRAANIQRVSTSRRSAMSNPVLD